ncbi:MAG: ATP-binding protein [Planctomycetota bacterium]
MERERRRPSFARHPRFVLVLLVLAAVVAPGGIISYLTLRTISQEEQLLQQTVERRCKLAAERVRSEIGALTAPIEEALRSLTPGADLESLSLALEGLVAAEPLTAVSFVLRSAQPALFPGFQDRAPEAASPLTPLDADTIELFDDLMVQGELAQAEGDAEGAAAIFLALADAYADQVELRASALNSYARSLVAGGRTDEALEAYLEIAREPVRLQGPDRIPVATLASLRAAELFVQRNEPDEALRELAHLVVDISWESTRRDLAPDWIELIEERTREIAARCAETSDEARETLDRARGFAKFLPAFTGGLSRELERVLDGDAHLGSALVAVGRLIGETPLSVMATVIVLSDGTRCLAGVALDFSLLQGMLLSEELESELATSWRSLVRLVPAGSPGMVEEPSPGAKPSGAKPPGSQPWYEQDLGAGLEFCKLQVFPLDLDEVELRERRATLLQAGVLLALFSLIVAVVVLSLRALGREVELARLKSEFVSSVSHELKTPLTAIRMLAEMLRAGSVAPEKQARYHETIERESVRLARLIDNILDFDRLERGERPFHFERASMAEIVSAAVETIRLEATAQGFSIELDVAPDLPLVRADRDALAEVVLNLLSNAVKYSDKVKEIQVRAAVRDAQVAVSVTDRGIGIAPADQARIFERFQRVEKAGRRTGGAGLGLAIARLIAEAHDGRLTVVSEPGVGSEFTLWLPLAKEGQDVATNGAGG